MGFLIYVRVMFGVGIKPVTPLPPEKSIFLYRNYVGSNLHRSCTLSQIFWLILAFIYQI